MSPTSTCRTLPILVFNGGSSSVKFSMYATNDVVTLLYEGEVSKIGSSDAQFALYIYENGHRQSLKVPAKPNELESFRDAVRKIATTLGQPNFKKPSAIGHRVVHSGPELNTHQRVTPHVFRQIERSTPFAPLHQPLALEIIREAQYHFPSVENYVCFDTIFHQSIPIALSTYPLSKDLREQGIHRYGFHGLSCESILKQFQDGRAPQPTSSIEVPARLIFAHLGAGASITAVQDGNSIDNTMYVLPAEEDQIIALHVKKMHEDFLVNLCH